MATILTPYQLREKRAHMLRPHQLNGCWLVPSQYGHGQHKVENGKCSCPDFQKMWAVALVLRQRKVLNGEVELPGGRPWQWAMDHATRSPIHSTNGLPVNGGRIWCKHTIAVEARITEEKANGAD